MEIAEVTGGVSMVSGTVRAQAEFHSEGAVAV